MPINEAAGTAPNLSPKFKQRLQTPVKGMNTVRPPHEIGEMEIADSVNFWVSPYGKFGTRWGTRKMMPVPLSTSGIGEAQYPVTKSTTGTDYLSITNMDYLPSSDVYILFADRRVFAIPRVSYWGLNAGWSWGEWETLDGNTVREAVDDDDDAPSVRYYMSDKGEWFTWDCEEPVSLVVVEEPATLPCAAEAPGGRALYLGLTNALTSDAPIISALFYGKLYVATGGALQVVYTVRDIDLDEDPHSPEDRAVGDIYVETLEAHALSNPSPDQAGAIGVRANRLWVTQRAGSKVWYSGVDDAKDWGWDGTGDDPAYTGGSFNVDRDDGGVLNGLVNFTDRLMLFKYDANGVRNTVHRVIGSLSGADGDYLRREQAAEGISAIDARCICPSGDDVLFAGAGGIYSLQLVDSIGNVGSIPQSLRVNSVFDEDRPKHMGYSARYGVAFAVLTSGQVMMLHRGAEGWFRFIFAGFTPSCVSCLGDDMFFGSREGTVLRFDRDVELDGVDSDGSGGNNPSKAFLSRVFTFDQPPYRSFFEKFMLAVSVRSSGRVYLDVRTDYGSVYQRTIPFAGEANVPVGWDDAISQWDTEATGWDRTGVELMQAKVSKGADNFQIRIASTAALDVLDMIAYGAYTTDPRWKW